MNRRSVWLIAAAALAVRLVLLIWRGDYIVYDEGYYLLLSRSIASGEGFSLNGLPHVALSPLQPLLVALLTLPGTSDIWVSRLLGALCSAALVVPAMSLTGRLSGPRAALVTGVFVAASPALMSFTPFFPGRSWNLYFGSEPLYLLLLLGAVAFAAAATSGGGTYRYAAAGLLAALSFLARAEGIVAAPLVFIVMAAALVRARAAATEWRRLALAVLVSAVTVSPYLVYLRVTLGRWAFSGRVQAASSGNAPAPTARESARHGGSVLDDFVWRGNVDRFTTELHRLSPDGSRMTSQYWGVTGGVPRGAATPPATVTPRSQDAGPAPAPGAADTVAAAAQTELSMARSLWRGLRTVMPSWLMVLGVVGLAGRAHRPEVLWLLPVVAASLIPAVLAYVEPRVLLGLVPAAAIGAGCALGAVWERLAPMKRAGRVAAAAVALLAALLIRPAVRDGLDARANATPLQQVATAQRAVGAWLHDNLPAHSPVMSWHPAVAIWAQRPWRVLPHDSLPRILRYASRLGVRAVVLSRFNPTPVENLPRPFTILLLDSSLVLPEGQFTVSVEPVFTAPLLFAGRLVAPAP